MMMPPGRECNTAGACPHTGHPPDELSAMGAHAREDVLDVVDGEHDATYAQRVHWRVLRRSSDRFGRVERIQLDPSVAVRSALE